MRCMNGKSGAHELPKDLSLAMASSQDPPPPQPPPNGPVPPPPPPDPPPPPPPSPVGCFLTTAVVEAMRMDDASEPLQLARYLRDHKMTGGRDRKASSLLQDRATRARSTNDEWLAFWQRHMRQITVMIKLGEYDLAKKLYTLATARLIHQKATRFADVELVDAVYDYGLRGFAKDKLPYAVRYGLLKAAFAVGRLRVDPAAPVNTEFPGSPGDTE